MASLGCGHGYFTIPLAKMVGNTGKVYAVDIREDALASVRSRAETENLKNIESVRANLEKENGTGLPNAECDFAILANILFQSQKKTRDNQRSGQDFEKPGQAGDSGLENRRFEHRPQGGLAHPAASID